MNIGEQVDTLQSEIDQKRREIRTDHYSMSIGEWISLYQQEQIEINPEFHKLFHWSDYQKITIIGEHPIFAEISAYQCSMGIQQY